MKIERKENSGLVEFGLIKSKEMFECDNNIFIKTNYDEYTDSNCFNLTTCELDNCLLGTLVKHYPNAKLVLGEN